MGSPGPQLEFRILGPLEVAADGTLLQLGGPKQRALLAVLAINAGRVVSVDRLTEDLWGDSPPKNATTSLHALGGRGGHRVLLRSRLVDSSSIEAAA